MNYKRILPNKEFRLKLLHILSFIPDEHMLKIQYFIKTGKNLNIKEPKTFNEKLQWLKLYDRNSDYTTMVDKYEVYKYIEKKIGKEYLIPLLGVWNSVEDIDWVSLPNRFVMKNTHDSGGVVICRDKRNLDIHQAKEKLQSSFSLDPYTFGREWPYKNVKPRIIAQKFLKDEDSKELKDYKFFCFNGEVKLILVVEGLGANENPKRNFYDKNWNLLPFNEGNASNIRREIKKPINYDKMIEIAELLSKDIPFVRVDLYEVNKKIYFGELTFYPQSGYNQFEPKEYNEILGNWLTLPQKSNKE